MVWVGYYANGGWAVYTDCTGRLAVLQHVIMFSVFHF